MELFRQAPAEIVHGIVLARGFAHGRRSAAIVAIAATLALAARPDAILTPHNAFNTRESVERKSAQSIEQLEHLRRTGRFLWPVP